MESERLELHRLLVDDISKGLEQVKQQKLSCSNKEQERGLQRMLSSYEEALSILTGRAPQEPCESVITSSSNPPPPSSNSASKVTEFKGARHGIYKRKTKKYTWRKYGQKDILGSKYPRSYFKCVSRGCTARKQVHRLDEDSIVYDVTYTSEHTCKAGGETTKTEETLINQQLPEEMVEESLSGTITGEMCICVEAVADPGFSFWEL